MTESHKVCPICEARNHRNAALCATCGATIADVAPRPEPAEDESHAEFYDYRFGETDLAETSLKVKGRILSAIMVTLFLIAIGGAAAIALAPRLRAGETDAVPAAHTALPTRKAGPTVTPGTPTATFTASPIPSATPSATLTPVPCVRRVAEGDSLIAIITRCGHDSLAILPTVMAINKITDETRIQIGQEIIVPRPSPTADPAATPAADDSVSAESREAQLERLAFDPFAPTRTPTLLPGLMWHVVQLDEDMIYIAAVYETHVKVLSDLNPEIEFLLCDFGAVYGGPECIVQLWVGQHIRVHAPASTITPIPTASGFETPTPRPTATFNAPIAQSPANEAFYSALEQVTLRWVGTGRLAANEVYRVNFANLDTGERYQAETRELFLIVPSEWQSQDDESHQYTWQISVLNSDSKTVANMTEVRNFVWQGTGRTEA